MLGDWILYPLMLGGWNQLIIYPLLPKAAFQDIFLICYDAQKANYVKRNSLRCYSIVPSRSPNENLHGNPSTLDLLGGRFDHSMRLWGNWQCLVQIWPHFLAMTIPSLLFWLIWSITWKETVMGHQVCQIRPWRFFSQSKILGLYMYLRTLFVSYFYLSHICQEQVL